mmetsp:Transcript_28271/g.79069  ORF Transcript_28271/g.79069 Transcript_28271/m.79069 type:complete len:207 (-) Transcript_28271:772-1392(-)
MGEDMAAIARWYGQLLGFCTGSPAASSVAPKPSGHLPPLSLDDVSSPLPPSQAGLGPVKPSGHFPSVAPLPFVVVVVVVEVVVVGGTSSVTYLARGCFRRRSFPFLSTNGQDPRCASSSSTSRSSTWYAVRRGVSNAQRSGGSPAAWRSAAPSQARKSEKVGKLEVKAPRCSATVSNRAAPSGERLSSGTSSSMLVRVMSAPARMS